MKTTPILLITLLAFFPSARADWPQWRGPNHDGVSKETNWNPQWQGEPKRLWSAKVGEGFSSITVAQGRALHHGPQRKNRDRLLPECRDRPWRMDARLAKRIQAEILRRRHEQHAGGRWRCGVCFRAVGRVDGAAAATGKVLWQKNLADELRLKAGTWGFAGSPLVDGERLIVNAGTHGTAVNKANGKVIWQSGSSETGYATPVPFSSGGKALVAIMGKEHVFAVERASGRLAWKHPGKRLTTSTPPIQSSSTARCLSPLVTVMAPRCSRFRIPAPAKSGRIPNSGAR